MKPTKTVFKMCAAALMAAGATLASAGVVEGPQAQAAAGITAQTDRLIVKYKDADAWAKGGARVPALGAARQAIVERAGQQFGLSMKLLKTSGTGAHVFHLGRKMPLDEVKAVAAELIARDASVEYAEPDRIMTKLATPNDPLYTSQWHYFEATAGLRLPGAWDKSTGAGINVAVIDTATARTPTWPARSWRATTSSPVRPSPTTAAGVTATPATRATPPSPASAAAASRRRTSPRAGTARTWRAPSRR
jgi:hypothetical protein